MKISDMNRAVAGVCARSFACVLLSMMLWSCRTPYKAQSNVEMEEKLPMQADGIVRLSKIEVYPEYLETYVEYAAEVGEISLRTEPGVLAMYAVCEKENPCKITILEIYASQETYRSHIASAHFQKYKQGTLHMVKTLILSDQTPLNPASRVISFIEQQS